MGSKRLLITCLIILFAFANTRPGSCEDDDAPMRDRYRKWAAKYGRTQKDTHQRERRYEIYKANVQLIEAFNSVNDGYKLTDNKFADLTSIEFRKEYLGLKSHSSSAPLLDITENQEHCERSREMIEDMDIPPKMDWRKKGSVTEVKDQGQCGACWAFSAVAAIEGITQIKTGRLVSLSEQELVDCDTSRNTGCLGGLMTDAYDFIRQNGGLTSRSDYPYQATQENCQAAKLEHHVATISGYRDVAPNERSLLKAAVSQPVSVGIDASSFTFQFYSEGVYNGPCDMELNHAVTIVGYDTDGKDKYWIVKNSWGANWGESGYVRMKREIGGDIGDDAGLCGIAMLASYPLI